VWLDKTGQVETLVENEAMATGNVLEQSVLDFASERLGPIVRNQRRVLTGTPLASNIDAILHATNEPIEAKTSGLFGPLPEGWGEEGTDEIPATYLVQCHVHMLCIGEAEVCHLAALLGGRGLCMFHVDRVPDLADIIRDMAIEFWEKYVKPCTPPTDVTPHLDMIRKVRRVPNKIAVIPAELVLRREQVKEAVKLAKQAESEADAAILAAMGDAEAASYGDEVYELTFFEQQRSGYTVKPCTMRCLRKRKQRKEKV